MRHYFLPAGDQSEDHPKLGEGGIGEAYRAARARLIVFGNVEHC